VIFGTKTLYTTNEILDSLLKTGDIKDATGAVSITKKDGRKTVASGKIFFRNELIYAVEVTNREIPIGKRVESGGLVDQDDLDGIFRRLGSKTSPQIVDQLLISQLISEKNVNNYVKEHFIETLSDILSWDNSTGEWHPNVTTKDFVMPYVALDKIRAILANRASFRKDFAIAVRSFFKDNEIDALTFVSNIKDASDYPAEIRAILRRANGEFTVDAIAGDTGISHFAVFQSVISLWKKGLLTLRLGGIDLPFASLQEAVKPTTVEEKAPAEEAFVPLVSESDSNAEPEVDPEEESIKADVAVAEHFVSNTQDYTDEDETVEESSSVADEILDSVEEDEIAVEETEVTDDSSASPVDSNDIINSAPEENVLDGDDIEDEEFITSDEDENVYDEVILTDEDDFIVSEEGDLEEILEEKLPEFVEDAEDDEEPEEMHFSSLPLPATYAPIVNTPVIIEPELKEEQTLPTPSNVNEAHQTIATFTSQLADLQGKLSTITTSITQAKDKLDAQEIVILNAEAKFTEAQREFEQAKNDLDNAKQGTEEINSEISASEAEYASTVKDIESLIHSFKFSG